MLYDLPCSFPLSVPQDVDEEDERALQQFMSKDAPMRRTLADIIMEKLTEKKTEVASQMTGDDNNWSGENNDDDNYNNNDSDDEKGWA